MVTVATRVTPRPRIQADDCRSSRIRVLAHQGIVDRLVSSRSICKAFADDVSPRTMFVVCFALLRWHASGDGYRNSDTVFIEACDSGVGE
jgi:hypothetical protein